MNFTIVILSGGKSSRMGQTKAFLPIGNQTEIERLTEFAKSLTNQVMIVTNDFDSYKHLDVHLVEDIRKGYGPLAGLEAALSATSTEVNFVIACDMPFVRKDLLQAILSELGEYDVAIPRINGLHHPLFAAYRKSTLPLLKETLDEGHTKIMIYLNKCKIKWLTETDLPRFDNSAFFNMNNPEEYEEAKRIYNLSHLKP
ncbi:MAG: molybdenum cofactor guanylyltransferase [Bacillales bacterium]|jgi:molybdopterin-guanine dinucleotide biosynthesis protein A|nr:molybdenum cofactor guanylyltransferase [Bacillales bacterium]